MKRAVLIIVGVVIAGVLASMGLFGSNDSKIRAAAAELNKTLPKMLDPLTRIDHVEPSHNCLTYEYTIMEPLGSNLTAQQKQAIQEDVRNTRLPNAEFMKMLKAGITAHYVYHSEQGATLLDFSITSADAN